VSDGRPFRDRPAKDSWRRCGRAVDVERRLRVAAGLLPLLNVRSASTSREEGKSIVATGTDLHRRLLNEHRVVAWYRNIEVARKNMTLRLPAEQADELEAVARAEGISVSDAVREAIAEHIARKRKDKAFRERLRAVVERDREILERLAR
jgi:hypothetical protein